MRSTIESFSLRVKIGRECTVAARLACEVYEGEVCPALEKERWGREGEGGAGCD